MATYAVQELKQIQLQYIVTCILQSAIWSNQKFSSAAQHVYDHALVLLETWVTA